MTQALPLTPRGTALRVPASAGTRLDPLVCCYKFCVLKVPELVSDAQTLNRPSLLKQ